MLFWFSCWTKRGMRWIIALSNQRSFSPNRYYEQLWGMVWLLFNRCPLSNERAMAALLSLQTPEPERAETHNASTVLMWCRNQEITNKRFSIPDKQSIHLQREVPSLPKSPSSHFCVVVLHWFVWDFAPYRFRKHFSRLYTASKKNTPHIQPSGGFVSQLDLWWKEWGKNLSWR